jgi:IclR family acetate operon transcriptional repressor
LDRDKSGGTVQSLERAIRLLEIIAEGDGLPLVHVARQAGLPPSTVHRILATLEQRGLVRQDKDRGDWLIGVRAFQIGSAFLRNRKVSQVARPFMRELMESAHETVSMAVEEAGRAVFLVQYESHSPVRTFHRPGSSAPMHASALGKSLMAAQGDRKVRRFLERYGLPTLTAKTIVDPGVFERELRNVRQRGWAIDDEEHTLGMRCVGAPIYNEHGDVLAAISVSGPTARMTDERLMELGPHVKRTARAISDALGGVTPTPA